jgi:hypothetical protein
VVAEFEANIGHQRTREGMTLAKKNGKLKGKQPKLPEPARPPLRRGFGSDARKPTDLQRGGDQGRGLFARAASYGRWTVVWPSGRSAPMPIRAPV